ncbi:hypothetical protein ACIBCO_31085 [Streptomyces violascens]|uniref:hypothetical protein n=1 Tax=Streptomyces violascens TaxID=67381 RepID=UPI0037B32E1B
MDWNIPEPMGTWVLDKIFDPADGWDMPAAVVPVNRTQSSDGNPNYLVTVDGIIIRAWEAHRWGEGVERAVTAGRLAARVEFTGITIHDFRALLTDNFSWSGLPAFGFNSASNQPSLHTGFPIAAGFPVDLARRQLKVCMGLLAITSRELLTAWNQTTATPQRVRDWSTAEGIASVAATFLRGLFGES